MRHVELAINVFVATEKYAELKEIILNRCLRYLFASLILSFAHNVSVFDKKTSKFTMASEIYIVQCA